jgi:hypothetical protein
LRRFVAARSRWAAALPRVRSIDSRHTPEPTMQRSTPTVILATIAASAATLLMALSPALAPQPAVQAEPRTVLELPRVVITGVREPRIVELPRVVITARRADATQTADAGNAAQPLVQQRAL